MTRKYKKPLQPLASWTESSFSSEDGSVPDDEDDFQQFDAEWQSDAGCSSSLDPEDTLREDGSSRDESKTSALSSTFLAQFVRTRMFLYLLSIFLLGMVIGLSVAAARSDSSVPLATDVHGQQADDAATDFNVTNPPLNDNPELDSSTSSPTETTSTLSPFDIQDTPLSTSSPTAPANPETSIPTATFGGPDTLVPMLPTAPPSVASSSPSIPPSSQPPVASSSPSIPPSSQPPVASASQLSPAGETVVLYPNEYLAAGQFRSSPNGKYKVGLNDAGDFMLMDGITNGIIWSTSTTGGNGARVYMQPDGNSMVRNAQKTTVWSSETHGYPGARMILSDSGLLAIKTEGENDLSTTIWMDGIPRSIYHGPPPEELTFPVRGAFYYPWYPQTWHVNGQQAHYNTALGSYSSSDPKVAVSHINAMEYAHIDLSIASWWGPNTHLDKARLTMLLDETVAMNSPLKWSVYYEDEMGLNPSVEEIRNNLDYLKKWFVWHEAWAHKEGKPVIFVYNEAGCDIASRWMEASNGEWYVVLKLFPGFMNCPNQPESWHQYGCGDVDGSIHNPGHSFVICPGFWRADQDVPLVPRVNQDTFCQNSGRMTQSGEPWQLIVSFNEAGEGTLIENSPEWPSDSGHGLYLDCLHDNF